MNSQNQTRTHKVPLSSRIELPEKISYRQFEDKHLFIAPYNPTWIVTNDIGAFMLAPIKEGHKLADVIDFSIEKLGISKETATNEIKTLLEEIDARGFYKDAKPEADKPEDKMASLQLFLTRACNINCIHCYMDGGPAMEEELTLREWKSIIDVFTDIYGPGWITLSGGEPLFSKDFYEIAAYGKQKGHLIYLLTNGTLISNLETARRIAPLVDNMQISLDGASREVTDAIRGKGVFDKAVKAVHLMKQMKKNIKLAFTVLPENIKDLEKNLVPLVVSFDYPSLSVNIDDKPTNLGRATELKLENILSKAEIRHSLDTIMRQIWAKGWAKRPTGILNRHLSTCGIGNGFTVDANGDVYPCPMPVCKFGNIRNEEIAAIAEKINNLLEYTNVEKMKKCANCDLKYICIGGCRVLSYEKTGDLQVPSCDQSTQNVILYRMIDRWI